MAILTVLALPRTTVNIQPAINISTAEKSSTKTKTLADTKAKKPVLKVYQLAYINDKGELIKLSTKYSFVEALQLLGFTNAKNTLNQTFKYNGGGKAKNMIGGYSNWGIYTKEKAHAKAIAVVFGCNEAPEVHGSGNYGHYHDDAEKHHIHIWFGGTISY